MTAVTTYGPEFGTALHRAIDVLFVLARDLQRPYDQDEGGIEEHRSRLAAEAMTLSQRGRRLAVIAPGLTSSDSDPRCDLRPIGMVLIEASSLSDPPEVLDFIVRYADVYRAVKRLGLAD